MQQVKDFLLVFAGAALLAACGGGGGGGGGSVGGDPGTYNGPVILSPARAMTGTASIPELKDSTGAETFGSPGFAGANIAVGTRFGLTQASMRTTAQMLGRGGGAPFAIDDAGVTLEVVQMPYNPGPGAEGDAIFRVNIPSLDVNNVQVIFNNSGGVTVNADHEFAIAGTNLEYALIGAWANTFSSNDSLRAFGVFFTGFRTPVGSIPGGSANFAGESSGLVITGANSPDQYVLGTVEGNVAFNVNFATGAISGNMTNMVLDNGTVTSPWNNVAFSANMIGGTSTFTGTTNTTTSTSGPLGLVAGSTGFVDGGFFGPNAEEAAAVWSLYNDNVSALGVFIAEQ